MRWLVIACVLAGCGKDKPSDAEQEFILDSARQGLPKIKAATASKAPHDGMIECAANVANLDELKHLDKALGDQIDQLCNHDLWAAQVKVSVEAIEAQRKAKPNAGSDEMFVACADPFFSMAKDELTRAKKIDPATQALLDRYAAICPK